MTNETLLDVRTGVVRARETTGTRAMLRHRIGGELEALSAHPTHAAAGRIRELGQLLAGLADQGELNLDAASAGFGSIVDVRDAITGEDAALVLMTGTSIDVLENQVSMDSPIGAALKGSRRGDVVEVDTPAGPRRLEVRAVTTLLERFA